MNRRRIKAWWLVLALLAGGVRAEQEYQQLQGAMPVRSTFSTGELSIEQLARLAVAEGLQVLVFGDGDLLRVEYGVPGLRRLVRFRRDHHSLITEGKLGAYLAEIDRVDALFPELILIDGVESAPFYYWEVDLGQRRWVLRHWNRRLLAVGLGREDEYARLPVMGSEALQIWHWSSLLLLWPVFGLLYGWVARQRHPAWCRQVVVGFSVLCLINNYPFKVELWNAYRGDLGSAPYQFYLDSVIDQDGLVFWLTPQSSVPFTPQRLLGGFIELIGDSSARSAGLIQTRGYTGFAALHGDQLEAAQPGAEWDRLLREYLHDSRQQPVWGIGENACRAERAGNCDSLQHRRTVFLVRQGGREGVLEAMRQGRMYATEGKDARLRLEEFWAMTEAGRGVVGEEVHSRGEARVQVKLTGTGGSPEEAEIMLIKAGRIIAQVTGRLPLEFGHLDNRIAPNERTYYRLLAYSRNARLVSNPIFVTGSEP